MSKYALGLTYTKTQHTQPKISYVHTTLYTTTNLTQYKQVHRHAQYTHGTQYIHDTTLYPPSIFKGNKNNNNKHNSTQKTQNENRK